jgi:polyisoprenoid-binding protein YceI
MFRYYIIALVAAFRVLGGISLMVGERRIGAHVTTQLNRQDFGVKWNRTLDGGGVVVGDEVEITLDLELMQPAAR